MNLKRQTIAFLASISLICATGHPDTSVPERPWNPSNGQLKASVYANSGRSEWPDKMNGRSSFDRASRAEILLYVTLLSAKLERLPTAQELGIAKVNDASIARWKQIKSVEWGPRYTAAAKSCQSQEDVGCGCDAASFKSLVSCGQKFINQLPREYYRWKEQTLGFYLTYISEQLRLAALFPEPTSEILPLGDGETLGSEFDEGQFLMTFDDGGIDVLTARYADTLRKNRISSYFFVRGESLNAALQSQRIEMLQSLYQGQCLGSHGYVHNWHQFWPDWQKSLLDTEGLIKRVFPNVPVAFRPPYGNATAQIIDFVKSKQHAPTVLWTIDSQDWQAEIGAEGVAARVSKLMLLYRKGIILFHDVHQPALDALPRLITFARAAQLTWVPCERVRGEVLGANSN